MKALLIEGKIVKVTSIDWKNKCLYYCDDGCYCRCFSTVKELIFEKSDM